MICHSSFYMSYETFLLKNFLNNNFFNLIRAQIDKPSQFHRFFLVVKMLDLNKGNHLGTPNQLVKLPTQNTILLILKGLELLLCNQFCKEPL